jgi:hypothetical protein
MEIRVILRGALAGLAAGVLGFIFSKIFVEPYINKSIAYESGRDAILGALNKAAGRPVAPDGPEIFSRDIQSTIGIATGLIGFSVAMGVLVAVAYLVLHGRFGLRPSRMAWLVAGLGFLGVYLLPFVKYPANPPAVGHMFTIGTRSELYLATVACSLILLGLAAYLAVKVRHTTGALAAVLICAAGFLVLYGVLIGLLPSLGNLPANVAMADQFGYARAASEVPQPITNILSHSLTVNGTVIQPGQVAYPGFDPDVLWKFRWYSIINQLIIWTAIALGFGALLDRFILGRSPRPAVDSVTEPSQPVPAGQP